MQYVFAAFAAIPLLAGAGQIRGRVTDGASGEALARVEVGCEEDGRTTHTAADGRFRIETDGAVCLLRVSSVGYRPLTQRVEGAAEVDVALMPDAMTRSQAVHVFAGPYASETADSVSLAGNELRNLASVLADDPLRAVQGLPGVGPTGVGKTTLAFLNAVAGRPPLFDGSILCSIAPDLHIEVPAVPYQELRGRDEWLTSDEVRGRIIHYPWMLTCCSSERRQEEPKRCA